MPLNTGSLLFKFDNAHSRRTLKPQAAGRDDAGGTERYGLEVVESSGICTTAAAFYVKKTLESGRVAKRDQLPADHTMNIFQASISKQWKTHTRPTKVEDLELRLDMKFAPVIGEALNSWSVLMTKLAAQASDGVYYVLPYHHESAMHAMALYVAGPLIDFFDPNFGSFALGRVERWELHIADHLKDYYDSFKQGRLYCYRATAT